MSESDNQDSTTTAKPVDDSAALTNRKFFIVTLIVLILASNINLVVKQLRRTGFRLLQHTHRYILVALAIDDFLLALFTLVVQARNAYEGDNLQDIECKAKILSNTYSVFNAFVYCCGLLLLVIELRFVRGIYSIPREVASLVGGFLPYLAGLIVVLPLALANFDWDKCEFFETKESTLQRQYRALVVLTYLILPVLALLCFTVIPLRLGGGRVLFPVRNQIAPATSPAADPENPQGAHVHPPQNQSRSHPLTSQPDPQHIQPRGPPPQAQVSGQPSLRAADPRAPSSAPEVPSAPTDLENPEDAMYQEIALNTACILVLLFYIPYGSFTVGYTLRHDINYYGYELTTAFTETVTLFSYIRPVVTPFALSLECVEVTNSD